MEPQGLLPRLQPPPPHLPILSHINPFHFPYSTSWRSIFNIIFPSTHGSSKWSLSLMFPHQNPLCTSPFPIRATCPAYLSLLDLITRIIFGEQYRSISTEAAGTKGKAQIFCDPWAMKMSLYVSVLQRFLYHACLPIYCPQVGPTLCAYIHTQAIRFTKYTRKSTIQTSLTHSTTTHFLCELYFIVR